MKGYSSAEFCLRRVKSGLGYPAMPATPLQIASHVDES